LDHAASAVQQYQRLALPSLEIVQQNAVDFDELACRRIASFRFVRTLAHGKGCRHKTDADRGKRKTTACTTPFSLERWAGKTGCIIPRKMFHVLFSRIVIKVLEGTARC
jgi:hypothetical protein